MRTLGIVGYGSFGALLCEITAVFAPKIRVRVYSRRHEPDGKRFFTLEEVAQSDAVILSVPIHVFEETLVRVLPLMRRDTVIVDVATVKVHTTRILRRLARGRRWIATHPMWGPESYSKRGGDVSGFRIVITSHTLSDKEYTHTRQVLKKIGFDVVEMRAELHDKHLARTLFLTHFVGQVIHRAGFDRTAIDTVSFGFLMDAVESVKHDEKLFKDVYTFNPYCREVLERFEVSEEEVAKLLGTKK